MAETQSTENSWEVEDIPDPHRLYMRVHTSFIDAQTGALRPGVFRLKEGENGMSVDWEKYATPEDTWMRARDPNANGVISLNVGKVRSIPEQIVYHAPVAGNRAHSEIAGKKNDTEIRAKYKDLAEWVIPLRHSSP